MKLASILIFTNYVSATLLSSLKIPNHKVSLVQRYSLPYHLAKIKSTLDRKIYIWPKRQHSLQCDEPLAVVRPFGCAILVIGHGEVCTYSVSKDKHQCIGEIDFEKDSDMSFQVIGNIDGNIDAISELKFQEKYRFLKNSVWWHYFDSDGPRAPISLNMWECHNIGQKHAVKSSAKKWLRSGSDIFQSNTDVDLEIEVASTSPKVCVVKDFLSSFEADFLISCASKSKLEASQICDDVVFGDFSITKSRTSSHTWLERDTDTIIDTIYKRAADLLGIEERLLDECSNAESLQVVHYNTSQKYDYHYDWSIHSPHSRFITLLLYLNDQNDEEAGGETCFPFAERLPANKRLGITPLSEDSDATSRGFKIHPGKGSAVFFYNLLSDGNGDIMSLHSGRPVLKGEKWLANLWVWDSRLPRRNEI